MTDEGTPSGIKSFSGGFGSLPASSREAIGPAPPYRLLIAGDFGLPREGERHHFEGDLAELLLRSRPTVEVTAENLLGSFPATVSETIRLAALADLRPTTLLKQFVHCSAAMEALARGHIDVGGENGSRFDKLAELLGANRQAPVAGTTRAGTTEGDDGLFDLVDTSQSKVGNGDGSAVDLIADFIADNVAPAATGSPSIDREMRGAAHALIDAQALALLSSPRLVQVLENWHGLRLLLETVGRARELEVTLLQVASDSDAESAYRRLAGDDGAMHDDLLDLLLFANRCSARANGADMLKALAEAAETFEIVALATLTADFAGIPAEELAALDAPHQMLSAAGFEAFNALGAQAVGRRLAIFWNDGLIVEGSARNPELYMPAAWVAAAMVARSVVATGWPGLASSASNELSGFPVVIRTLRGRQVATATRVMATDESAAGLASAGIATLTGRIDRDSIGIAHAPCFASSRVNARREASLDDQLVLARLGQLLQATVPEVLGLVASPSEKADMLADRLARLAEAIPLSPRFTVTTAVDEERNQTIDITAVLPEGLAARRRFDFAVPC